MALDRNAAYRLADVQDHQGNSRVESRKLYRDRVGCLATDLHWEGRTLRMVFVRDKAGNWIRRRLRTSTVLGVEEKAGCLAVRTLNSVYLLEPAPLPEELPEEYPARSLEEGETGEVIELYLSEEGNHFCKGTYWDGEKTAHPLAASMHLGMAEDSCLIGEKDCMQRIWCRYYVRGPRDIQFYDTLYRQQDDSIPLLIHNCGTIPLKIHFESGGPEGRVLPGERLLLCPGRRDTAGEETAPSGI